MQCVRPMVRLRGYPTHPPFVLAGWDGSASGSSASGSAADVGLIPRVCTALLHRVAEAEARAEVEGTEERVESKVVVTFAELYMESAYDLLTLAPSKTEVTIASLGCSWHVPHHDICNDRMHPLSMRSYLPATHWTCTSHHSSHMSPAT